jgi:hypothetical protein
VEETLPIKDPSGKSGGEAAFSVTLECTVTKTLEVSGHWKLVQVLYEGGSATRTLKANQGVGITGDQEGVRDVLRGLMRTVTWLNSTSLTRTRRMSFSSLRFLNLWP